ELAPCIESLSDKGGQAASPVEQRQWRYKCSVAEEASARGGAYPIVDGLTHEGEIVVASVSG
ncbi:hypothetical protein L195_g017509, partial [Trifolium pratense]